MEKITNNNIGDFYMKKYIIFILIIITAILLIPNEESDFRIRVIANSDSREDQALKMKVVNAILEEVKSYDKNNIEFEIKNNIEDIKTSIEKVLGNRKYSIKVSKTRFPPKEANGEIIKGGNYPSLLVVIEEGKGKNWWSLLSPEFNKGFEDNETGDVEYKFFFFEEIKKGFK